MNYVAESKGAEGDEKWTLSIVDIEHEGTNQSSSVIRVPGRLYILSDPERSSVVVSMT